MATTPEGRVKAAVKRILQSYDDGSIWYTMPVAGGLGRRGVPDFLICCHGQFIAVETKAKRCDQPTALQQHELAKLTTSGASALVIHKDNLHLLKDVLALCKR